MNKFILISAVALTLVGCGDGSNQAVIDTTTEIHAPIFITNENIKEVSLDVVIGWTNNFMSNSSDGLNQVIKLQKVLKSWPESKQNNQEPCYMQLRNETARILNLIDGLETKNNPDEPDYKYECRQSIDYKYDEARIAAVWQKL